MNLTAVAIAAAVISFQNIASIYILCLKLIYCSDIISLNSYRRLAMVTISAAAKFYYSYYYFFVSKK